MNPKSPLDAALLRKLLGDPLSSPLAGHVEIEMTSGPLAADMETILSIIQPLLKGKLGTKKPQYDLMSAHLHEFDLKKHIPPRDWGRLAEYGERILADTEFGAREGLPRFEEVTRSLLEQETGLDTAGLEFICSPDGSRAALSKVMDELVWKGKVALPLPNWHFWGMMHRRYENKFEYFHAHNEQELVEKFEMMAYHPSVRALLLAFPAVPLMYTPSQAAMREIDRIALAHGITVIVDEVQRGMQPRGQRASVAQYLTRPIIVEGFSKRFGEGALEEATFVAAPKDLELGEAFRRRENYEQFSYTLGTIAEAALRHAAAAANEELAQRNRAFDRGLRQPRDVRITRPSPTHLTTLIELPPDYPVDAHRFSAQCIERAGLYVTPVQAFYPAGYEAPPELANRFRITIGKLPSEKLREAGGILREQIEESARQG